MTQAQPGAPAEVGKAAAVPVGIRVASTLCWIVGVLTILAALAIGIPALSQHGTLLPLLVTALAGVLVCAAAYLVRQQRKLGVFLLVVAWALPTAMAVMNHQSARGNLLLFAALLLAGANWKHLR